jgi:hypothetical protein
MFHIAGDSWAENGSSASTQTMNDFWCLDWPVKFTKEREKKKTRKNKLKTRKFTKERRKKKKLVVMIVAAEVGTRKKL